MILPIIIKESGGLKEGEYLYEKDGKWRKGYDCDGGYSIFDYLTGYHISRLGIVVLFVMWLIIDYLIPYTKTVKIPTGFISLFLFLVGYIILISTPTIIIVMGFRFIDKYLITKKR